ncbi:MAG: LacI family DNA-binding transcriptional regulator [Opitutaceae bacterium]|nr:LacI family DNA-binding transcriptional regulator [Opitutaceae bacterium]
MANRVSLQDIADKAGVHVSTVSLALRDDPRLTEETRARLKSMAEQLGYRSNPLVSAWLRQVRQPEVAQAGAGLAFMLGTEPRIAAAEPYYQTLIKGARAEAEELGYLVTEIRFDREDQKRLLKAIAQLRYRGVRGVLVFDPLECLPPEVVRELENGFAVIVMLRCGGMHRFHRVGTDISGNAALALTRLRELGCRRIAFPFYPGQVDRVRKDAMAAYLWQQEQWPRSDRVALPPVDIEFDPKLFIDWMRAQRPDAVLSVNFILQQYLLDAGFRMPGDLIFAHVGVDVRPGVTGIVNRGFEVGRAAVFKLAGLLTGNRFGVPEIPLNTLVPGVWTEPERAAPEVTATEKPSGARGRPTKAKQPLRRK